MCSDLVLLYIVLVCFMYMVSGGLCNCVCVCLRDENFAWNSYSPALSECFSKEDLCLLYSAVRRCHRLGVTNYNSHIIVF